MGAACGCQGYSDQDSQIEMGGKVDSEVTRGVKRPQQMREITDKEATAIQAAARGAAERRKLKQSGGPRIQKHLVNDSNLEFIEEIQLEDGSTYTG